MVTSAAIRWEKYAPRPATILTLLIVCGALARVVGLSGVPFEDKHDLRQYDTAAIARNFAEGSPNPLMPAADWGGVPGYVESEFPAFTWLVALAYRIFGIHEWLGGALNIAIYALSAWLLFRFVVHVFDERAGLFAAFFYSAVPLGVFYTRGFQPDALMALGSLAAVYYFDRWTERFSHIHFALSASGLTVAVLIKPQALYLGLPLLCLAYRTWGWRLMRVPRLRLYAVIVLIPPSLWYVHAFQLWETYGNSYFRHLVGRDVPALTGGFRWMFAQLIFRETIQLITTPAGAILLVVGAIAARSGRARVLHWWAMGFCVAIIIMSEQFAGHDYYLLPAVFIAAAWMGCGSSWLAGKNTWFSVPVAGICAATIWFSVRTVSLMLWRNPESIRLAEFARAVEQRTEPGALVIFLGTVCTIEPQGDLYEFTHRTRGGEYLGSWPQYFYLSHRKGWCIGEGHATPSFVGTLQRDGGAYLAIVNIPDAAPMSPELARWLECAHTRIDESGGVGVLYRLNAVSSRPDCHDPLTAGRARDATSNSPPVSGRSHASRPRRETRSGLH